MIKLFLIDEVHILNDITRGPVLEAVVSRMKTIEVSVEYLRLRTGGVCVRHTTRGAKRVGAP